MKDLVFLVPDKPVEFAQRGALGRPKALAIRPISHAYRAHMGRDSGAHTTGVEVLALETRRFTQALLVFDLAGSDATADRSAGAPECELNTRLQVLWGTRAKAIVIAPEADIWVWGSDNALRLAFGWPLALGIRDWLMTQGFAFDAQGKPMCPKEALDAMRPIHRQPRLSALYEKITAKISLHRSSDPAFKRLRAALQDGFPPKH